MSFFCLLQELYKYYVKGQAPGEAYVERIPFNLQHRFNSTTVQGRANVAKATMALVTVASLGMYVVGPSVVKALSEGTAATSPRKEAQEVTESA